MLRLSSAAAVLAACCVVRPAMAQTPAPPPAPSSPAPALPPPIPPAPGQPGQPAPPPTAAFDEALDRLLAQPGGLTAEAVAERAARASTAGERKDAETVQAREKVREIQRAIMPLVTVGASYTRLSELDAPQLAPGVSIPLFFNSWHLGGDVSLPLTDLFIRLPTARDSAQDGVVASELGARAARLSAAADAEVTFYEWIRAQLQVAVTTQLVDQVKANVGQVQALVDVKRAAVSDLLRIQAQQADAELGLARIRELVTIRELQLRLAIGAPDDEKLTIGEDVRSAVEVPPLPATDQLVTDARGRRLEAKAITAASSAVERALAGSKVGALPHVDLFGQVVYDNPNQRVFPQQDDFKLTWAAGVRVTWSLNNYLSVDPEVEQARAQVHALAADQHALALGIRTEIESARSSLELADRTAESTAQGLASAEEGYRVRQELLANERATAIELVDAATALTQARFAAIDALIDRRIAWVRLRHAAGLDLP